MGKVWEEANATLTLPAYYRILRPTREKADAPSMSLM